MNTPVKAPALSPVQQQNPAYQSFLSWAEAVQELYVNGLLTLAELGDVTEHHALITEFRTRGGNVNEYTPTGPNLGSPGTITRFPKKLAIEIAEAVMQGYRLGQYARRSRVNGYQQMKQRLLAQLNGTIAARDNAIIQRDNARAERDNATAERDQAQTDAANAREARDRAREEARLLRDERTHLRARIEELERQLAELQMEEQQEEGDEEEEPTQDTAAGSDVEPQQQQQQHSPKKQAGKK